MPLEWLSHRMFLDDDDKGHKLNDESSWSLCAPSVPPLVSRQPEIWGSCARNFDSTSAVFFLFALSICTISRLIETFWNGFWKQIRCFLSLCSFLFSSFAIGLIRSSAVTEQITASVWRQEATSLYLLSSAAGCLLPSDNLLTPLLLPRSTPLCSSLLAAWKTGVLVPPVPVRWEFIWILKSQASLQGMLGDVVVKSDTTQAVFLQGPSADRGSAVVNSG